MCVIDQILAEETAANAVSWMVQDRQGSVTDILDDSGTVVDHIFYDGYGNETESTPTAHTNGYAGYFRDTATGLLHTDTRWYAPAIGRWTSEDPIGFDGGDTNLSRYVGNGPTNGVDPTGRFKSDIHRQLTHIAAAAAGMQKQTLWGLALGEKETYDILAEANVKVDHSDFYDAKWHAQERGFVIRLMDNMRGIKAATMPAGNIQQLHQSTRELLTLMGQALHVLQDFYSHTDWIDGYLLCPTYRYYQDTFHENRGMKHPIRLQTLNLKAIYNGNRSGLTQPQEIFYFAGGTNPFAGDDHNRYAADKVGYGRDGAKFLPGSYKRAYNSALRQSIEFLEWCKQNMNIQFRLYLFNLDGVPDDPTSIT
jgi:RHS repeat-associated protein